MRVGEDPLDFPLSGADGEQASASAIRAGGGGFRELPGSGLIIEAVAGNGSHRTGVKALAAEFAPEGTMEVRIDDGPDAPSRKRELSHALDFITDSHTAAAEDTLVPIPLQKGREIVRRKGNEVPGIEGFLHPIFIDQVLEVAFPLLFTSRTDHGMIE
jgi:hypothetical protein